MQPADGDRRATSGPPAFTCPHYAPVRGGRRCASYLDGGACARADEFMCTEFLKANGYLVPPPSQPEPTIGSAPQSRQEARAPVDAGRALSSAEIASFKALEAETCITFDGGGPLWIVREYTGADRQELSIDHAATLAALGAVFPDARLLAFRRRAAGQHAEPEMVTGVLE